MKIRTLIVEDEPGPAQLLKEKLSGARLDFEIIGHAESVSDGLKMIRELKPALVFMDIMIKEGSSFDILEQLDSIDFQLIFVTGHNEHAIRAIKLGALDYLMKPIDDEEFNELLPRLENSLELNANHSENAQVALDQYNSEEDYPDRFMVSESSGARFIKKKELVRMEGSSGYCYFYLKGGERLVLSRTIKYFEDLLDPEIFLRVHRSHVVNIEFIRQVETSESPCLVMDDGTRIPIARRKKAQINEALKKGGK